MKAQAVHPYRCASLPMCINWQWLTSSRWGQTFLELSLMHQRIPPPVANVKHGHNLALNGEQDAVLVRLAAIDQLPHFKREIFVFRGKGTTGGKFTKRGYCLPQP